MKMVITSLLRLLFIAKATPAEGRLLNEVEQQQVAGGEGFGYISAKAFWSSRNGTYNCTNIYTHFWEDVKNEVFPDCENNWIVEYRNVNASACKSGVEKFTMDQIGACFTTTDCSQLGYSASGKVAKTFCSGLGLATMQKREFIPARCKDHALASCKSDAVNKIEKIMNDGGCLNVTGSALDHVRPIHKLCETEIDEMENQAELPYGNHT